MNTHKKLGSNQPTIIFLPIATKKYLEGVGSKLEDRKKTKLIATNKPTNFAAAASPSLGVGPSPELSSAGSTDAGVGFASRSITAFR